MTTPRIEEILKKYDVRYFDGSTYAVSEEFEKDLVQLEAQAYELGRKAGIDEAVENMPTKKRWRKMLEGLGRGFVIYITPEEKELLLLSLREVDTLQEARQKTSDDTIKALQDKK